MKRDYENEALDRSRKLIDECIAMASRVAKVKEEFDKFVSGETEFDPKKRLYFAKEYGKVIQFRESIKNKIANDSSDFASRRIDEAVKDADAFSPDAVEKFINFTLLGGGRREKFSEGGRRSGYDRRIAGHDQRNRTEDTEAEQRTGDDRRKLGTLKASGKGTTRSGEGTQK